ncbi:MAG: radical SAM protein [Deltaproteobacteria bacterium]|nr:radical SAM protein [Deltaproteobacteria bacterium]
MSCEGCYRENDPRGDRPLEDVIKELEQVKKLRKTGGISIAGGEPLIYPHIVDLVRYVAGQGWKPIIISNGMCLTPELVGELRKAGLVAFTVHVDSHQQRPDWIGKTEAQLNALRLHLAEIIRDAGHGRISCGFNATIYPDTLKDIPMLTRWGQAHMDVVHTMVYILFRQARVAPQFDYFVEGRQIDPAKAGHLRYLAEEGTNHRDIMSQEVVDLIREVAPEYEPCAFLNSNQDPNAVKWLLGVRAGGPDRILGYMNGRFIEMIQVLHHLVFGTYTAYSRPGLTKVSQALFPLALINRGMFNVFWNWLKDPSQWLKRVHLQSILIIQPPDVLADGRQAMCDGCPDGMYYEGRMIWKCRLDEIQKFGDFIQCVPKGQISD